MGWDVTDIAGRIELVQGPLGAGKTTFAARLARKTAQRYGLQLVSNADLGPDWHTVHSWRELSECRHAVILIDEVHLTIPSDKSLGNTQLFREAVEALTYLRKRRQMLVGTAQRWSSVSNIYKELGTRFVRVAPWIVGKLHVAHWIEPDDLRRARSNQRGMPFSWYDPRKSYIDTFAEVRPWWGVPGDAR